MAEGASRPAPQLVKLICRSSSGADASRGDDLPIVERRPQCHGHPDSEIAQRIPAPRASDAPQKDRINFGLTVEKRGDVRSPHLAQLGRHSTSSIAGVTLLTRACFSPAQRCAPPLSHGGRYMRDPPSAVRKRVPGRAPSPKFVGRRQSRFACCTCARRVEPGRKCGRS